MKWLEIFKSPRVWCIIIATALEHTNVYLIFLLPLYLQEAFHLGVERVRIQNLWVSCDHIAVRANGQLQAACTVALQYAVYIPCFDGSCNKSCGLNE